MVILKHISRKNFNKNRRLTMKKTSIIIFTLILFLTGCDPFEYPTGIWVCEELNITVDFDNGGKGTIITDNVSEDIICWIDSGGYVAIDYLYEEREEEEDIYNKEELKLLYIGYFRHKDGYLNGQLSGGKGEIIFTAGKRVDEKWDESKEYTFVKVVGEGEIGDVKNKSIQGLQLIFTFSAVTSVVVITNEIRKKIIKNKGAKSEK